MFFHHDVDVLIVTVVMVMAMIILLLKKYPGWILLWSLLFAAGMNMMTVLLKYVTLWGLKFIFGYEVADFRDGMMIVMMAVLDEDETSFICFTWFVWISDNSRDKEESNFVWQTFMGINLKRITTKMKMRNLVTMMTMKTIRFAWCKRRSSVIVMFCLVFTIFIVRPNLLTRLYG